MSRKKRLTKKSIKGPQKPVMIKLSGCELDFEPKFYILASLWD